ncbi:MAG: ATP-binding protein, partial [Anaerolineales bacterium]
DNPYHTTQDCIAQGEQALDLWRGPLLPGFTLRDCFMFNEWVQHETFDLERKIAQLLQRLIACYRQLGEWEHAIALAHQLITQDDLNEASYRLLMSLHLAAHQVHDVMRVYEACVAMLDTQLGLEPSPETEALLQRARASQTDEHRAISFVTSAVPYAGYAFFGREDERERLLRLLNHDTCRLVTLVGIGGVGKTHLAVKLCEHAPQDLNQQAIFISLEDVTSPEQALLSLAAALQLQLLSQGDILEQIIAYLANARLLIVLDNIEQLVPHINAALVRLIKEAPSIQLLVTSRVMLELHEEHVIRLNGLAYPEKQRALDVAHLAEYDSVRFFLYWARKRAPDFGLNMQNAEAIAALCRWVEGVPLAIRLAAAWCELLTVDELLAEIQQNVNILQTSLSDIPAKHQSMRALFQSIWDQLTPDEQAAFMRLSIFRGGFTRQSAQQVADVAPMMLKSLLDKSLLLVDHDTNRRYHIHELLRLFAHEQSAILLADHILDMRYVQYFSAYINLRAADLQGYHQEQALQELDEEFNNLQQAWLLAVEHQDSFGLSVMLDGLYLYLRMRGYWNEGAQLFGKARDTFSPDDEHTRHLVNRLAARYYRIDDDDFSPLLHLLSAAQAAGDAAEVAYLVTELGWYAYFFGHYQLAQRYFRIGLAHYERLSDPFHSAEALRGWAMCRTIRGDLQGALALSEASLAKRQLLGDAFGLSMDHALRGELLFVLGHLDEALTEMLSAYAYLESHSGVYVALKQTKLLCWCHALLGDFAQAENLARRLVDVTDMPEAYGEHVIGLLALAFLNALNLEQENSLALLNKAEQRLSQPNLRTGEGVFSTDLRLLSAVMVGIIRCLNGHWDTAQKHFERLGQYHAVFQRPLVAELLFTGQVLCITWAQNGHLHPVLRAWLDGQIWLSSSPYVLDVLEQS